MEKVALQELGAVVEGVLGRIPDMGSRFGAAVIALSGDLGSGKTTFVQTLAKKLGIGEIVASPTYVLMKSYPISYNDFTTLIHIDAYRLESPDEFRALKPETFLKNIHNLVCIEWPERLDGAMPTPDVLVKFSADGAGEGERFIQVL